MDVRLNKRVTYLLTAFIVVGTALLQFVTENFSVGLLVLSSSYVAIVLIRDFVLKTDLTTVNGAWMLTVQFLLALTICMISENFIAQISVLILIGEYTFHQPRKHSIIFTACVYCLTLLAVFIYREFPSFDDVFLILPRFIDFFAVFGMSLLAQVAVQQKNQLARDNELLREASIKLERKTKMQERTRISREIHDSVGHTLTSALTGLQTASHAIGKNNYPLAQEMIDRTKEKIRSGLNDVRSSVHLLREGMPEHRFVPELVRLIDETVKQTNVDIDYRIDESIPELSTMVELTIYRALQEGLTNGLRHSSSKAFRFSLALHDGHICFMLENDGQAPAQIIHGFGLSAMKERVAEVGGELSIAAAGSSGGVKVEITIPLQMKAGERSEGIV